MQGVAKESGNRDVIGPDFLNRSAKHEEKISIGLASKVPLG